MTKMTATPIYGKNPSKIFYGPIYTKLEQIHKQMNKQKDENYIPVGVNVGGIIRLIS